VIERANKGGQVDFTLYWFMAPVSVAIATIAMLSGIGGAALFTPLFILIFPLLAPEYPLSSAVAAIGAALLTETFGFSSGFAGYFRKRLIDFGLAFKFLRISVPVAIVGALTAHRIAEGVLIAGYAFLVFILSIVLVFFHHAAAVGKDDHSPGAAADLRSKIDREGKEHVYANPRLGPVSATITSIGAFLTGLLSVGIGEVIVPQLTKRGVPVAVAAATSVSVVIITVAAASFTLIGQMMREGGLSAVPWNVVCYTIPGVIIGGQIGPLLQGGVSQRSMERAIGALFLAIAIAMAFVAAKKLGGAS